MYFQNTNLIGIATFEITQKHVNRESGSSAKSLPATTVETSNGKFHLVSRDNAPTDFSINLILFGSSFIRLKIQ